MNEAIGSAALFNIIITFVIVLILLFVGSISYSKAYKVKNIIVEEIEKHKTFDTAVESEIDGWLNDLGYKKDTISSTRACPSYDDFMPQTKKSTSNYHYCVYKKETCDDKAKIKKDSCGYYYRVVAYMYLELPLIEDVELIPVMGETMTFREIHNVESGEEFERYNNQ